MTSNRVRALVRRGGAGLGLLVLAASLVVGSDMFGVRERLLGSAAPPPRPSAFSRVVSSTPASRTERTVLRSSPWWQTVERFSGVGPTRTPAIAVQDAARQWRVESSCRRGHLVVRASVEPDPLTDIRCPAKKTTYVTQDPRGGLQVTADGPWNVRVEQQIDVPLEEPPLPAMTAAAAKKVASGRFYRVDQVGKGRVTIYRLPNGKYALRLQRFWVTPNTDLEIRLSPLRAPRSTRQFKSAPSALVKTLDVTAGSMNFAVPDGVDPSRYRSVVIWCERLYSGYAAATLSPAS